MSATKEAEPKRAPRPGFDINYALDHAITFETQNILDSLIDSSLQKAYHYPIQPEHMACECYYCSLNYMIRKTLMNRGTGRVALSEIEGTAPIYLFYEEWLDKVTQKNVMSLFSMFSVIIIVVKKMSSSASSPSKKPKIISYGHTLEEGFHIHYALKLYKDPQKLLDELSNLSVAKAYNALFDLRHIGCWCRMCRFQNLCFQTLLKRGVRETFLCGEIVCRERFQEAEESYPFFEEYFEQTQKWCDAVFIV